MRLPATTEKGHFSHAALNKNDKFGTFFYTFAAFNKTAPTS